MVGEAVNELSVAASTTAAVSRVRLEDADALVHIRQGELSVGRDDDVVCRNPETLIVDFIDQPSTSQLAEPEGQVEVLRDQADLPSGVNAAALTSFGSRTGRPRSRGRSPRRPGARRGPRRPRAYRPG